MALSAAAGSFTTGTGTGDLTAISGLSFQPKVILFAMTGAQALNSAQNTGLVSLGACSSTSARWAISFADNDAETAGNSSRLIRNDAVLAWLGGGEAVNGLLDVSAIASDGFTPTVDGAFLNSYHVIWLALGGADLTAEVGTYQQTGGTGTQEVNLAGAFQPSVVILSDSAQSAFGTAEAGGRIGLGWMTSTAQASCCIHGQDTADPTNTNCMTSTTRCLVNTGSTGTLSLQLSYVSLDSDGFTVNRDTGAGTPHHGYIALAGIQAYAGTTAARTDTNTTSVTAPGFQPRAVLFMQTGNPTATETATSADANLSVGWAVGAGGYGVFLSSEDNLADADSVNRTSNTIPIHKWNRTGASTWTDAGTADVDSLDATGFTYDQLTADSQATLIPYLALGDAPAAGSAVPIIRQTMER